MTNCVNCGAILHGSKCEYCETEYNNGVVVANFRENDYTGILKVGDKEFKVYIGNIESHVINIDEYRDFDGNLRREKPIFKRKFTLIEF